MCPNIGECWEDREATFLILGSKCTRRCGFCDVMTAKPDDVDEEEPARIADAVRTMGLRHVVLTGVARDDLPDGGAGIWAQTVRSVREAVPGCTIEVLPSDFKGGERDIATVIEAGPDVFAHNLETVRRLHGRIRPAFGYDRSLEVLRIAKRLRGSGSGGGAHQITKSNLILGMGERADEVAGALQDLVDAGCDIVTMGQYLQPTSFHLPVDRWVTPEEFAEHARAGESLGLGHVEAGPLVRSSYHAGAQLRRAADRGVTDRPVGRHRRLQVEESACKPDPVRGAEAPPATICLDRRCRSPCRRRSVLRIGAAYPAARAGRPRTLPVRPCSGWGLPAASVTQRAGALLPHRFTLTSLGRSRARRSALCCPVREVTPAWFSPAPCPVESGLSSSGPKTARGRPADSSAARIPPRSMSTRPTTGAATGGQRARNPRPRSRVDRPRCSAHAARVRIRHRRTPPTVRGLAGGAAADADS